MPRTAVQAAQAALDLVPVDPRRASAEAALALAQARRERDPVAKSMAYRALGVAARDLNDLDTALAALHSAVRVADSVKLAACAAQARMSRAFVYLSLGRMPAARGDVDAAVSALQGVDRARALALQATILQQAGELDRALAVYATALTALRRHGDRLWEARLRNNRSLAYALQGHLGRAKADLTRAAELQAAMGNSRSLARARMNLGAIEGLNGDIPAALAALDRATDEYRKGGWPLAEVLIYKTTILLSAGLASEALATAAAAVAELSSGQRAADLDEARMLLAQAQLATGSPDQARESATAARRGFTRQNRPGWAAVARYVEAHAAWAAGEQSPGLLRSARQAAADLEAVSWSTAALDLRLLAARIATSLGHLEIARAELRAAARARSSSELERRARAWHALALLRLQAGDRRGAYSAVTAGLTAAERVRLLLGSTELRVMVASHVAELARLGVSLAIEDGVANRVLWSAERYRAATLRTRPVLPPADAELAALRAQLRAITGEAERARLAGVPLHALERRQHALEEELRSRLRHHHGTTRASRASRPARVGTPGNGALDALASSSGGTASSGGAASSGGTARSGPPRRVRGGVPPQDSSALGPVPVPGGSAAGLTRTLAGALGESVLIEYAECGDQLYAVVVAGASGASHALRCLGPVGPLQADLEALRFAWRRLLTGHGSGPSLQAAASLAAHAAEQLDQAVLAPLAPLLADRPVVIVPSGSLLSLPWPMLPSCAGRPVSVAPSASSWLAARPGSAPGDPRRVVLIAGPGLPEAVAEVDSLAALYPSARVLAGPDATVASALRELEGADIAHVAAHGRYRGDNPMFSSLMLADGPLTVYDLERLRRAPRTIMLAACDAARATVHPGDEITGLASALLAAGASAVTAALLPLPDDVSAQVAYAWHAGIAAGRSPARALSATVADSAKAGPLARLAALSLVCLGHG